MTRTIRSASGARRIVATLVGVETEGAGLVVRYVSVRGTPRELEDRIRLGGGGDLESVHSVGRLLRVLRAARVQAPDDPARLHDDPDATAALLRRCTGTRVALHFALRTERSLRVWTEEGVQRFDRVVDVREHAAALEVRRRGSATALRIARANVIRFEVATIQRPEVLAVEVI
ncbi:MAG: hypothetical protein ACE5IL_03765 [Myxococcota bacterium]